MPYTPGILSTLLAIFAARRDRRPRYQLPVSPLITIALAPRLERRFAVTKMEALPPAGAASLPVLLATQPCRLELLARGNPLEPCGFLQRRWTARGSDRRPGQSLAGPSFQSMRFLT